MKFRSDCAFLAFALLICSTSIVGAQTLPRFTQIPQASIYTGGVLYPIEGAHSQWTSAAGIPTPKMYHATAGMDGFVYVFAGYSTSGGQNAPDGSCFKYHAATDTWTSIMGIPIAELAHASAVPVDGKVYLVGGCRYSSGKNDWEGVKTVFAYDPATDTYESKTDMPKIQFGCAVGVIDKKIYLIGGRNNSSLQYNSSYLDLIQVYDTETDSWSTSTVKYPARVTDIGSVTIDNKIITAGGFNSTLASPYQSSTYIGAIEGGTLTWTSAADYPFGGIRYPSAAALGSTAYFTGGDTEKSGNAIEWTYGFDVTAKTWTTYEKKITGIRNSRIASAGTVIVAPGGESAAGITSMVERFDPSAPMVKGVAVGKDSVVCLAGRSDTEPRMFKIGIENIGLTPQAWSVAVEGDCPWIAFSGATSGTLQGYEKAMLTMLIDASKLTDGRNTGAIKLTTDIPSEATTPVIAYLVDVVPTAEKIVLVEEFTGTWCGWCPYGADSLRAIEAELGDRVAILAYHSGDAMEVPLGGKMMDYIGVSAFPTGAVDRRVYDGETGIPISRDVWGANIRSILQNEESIVSIAITGKAYNEQSKSLSFTAEVTFLSAAQGQYRLVFIQTTNQRKFGQSRYNPSEWLPDYEHNHVVTAVHPDEYGYTIGDGSVIPANTKYSQDISVTSVDSLPSLSDLVLFVYEYNTPTPGKVMQAYHEPLLEGITETEIPQTPVRFEVAQNYPNPFNPSTMVRYSIPEPSFVRFSVYNANGMLVSVPSGSRLLQPGEYFQAVDGSGLPSGSYFCKCTVTSEATGKTESKVVKMTLMK